MPIAPLHETRTHTHNAPQPSSGADGARVLSPSGAEGVRVVTPSAAEAAPSPFARVLTGLGREVARGEATMHATLAGAPYGRDFGAAELLALQVSVYRYSEAVDLAAKLVDRASAAVKTVVTGQ